MSAPVLSWCADEVIGGLRAIPDLGLEAQFFVFDSSLKSHPDLAGYIELTSSRLDRPALVAFANGFISSCDANMEYGGRLAEPADAERFFRLIQATQDESNEIDFGTGAIVKLDPDSVYVVIGDDSSVSLFFQTDQE